MSGPRYVPDDGLPPSALDLDAIEARARAALTYERSVLNEAEGRWEHPIAEGEASEGWFECPLCEGEGELEGQRYDDKGEHAATVVAYGIGKGLALAEEWVAQAPADILALVLEVRGLRAVLEEAIANQKMLLADLSVARRNTLKALLGRDWCKPDGPESTDE